MSISTEPMIFPCGMSRSGTTLLATILDSHSRVSMAYELIPPPLPGPRALLAVLERGLELADNDLGMCGKQLRKIGDAQEGLFFARCHRAGLDADELRTVLGKLVEQGQGEIATFRDRLFIAWAVSVQSARNRDCERYGFKLNIPSVGKAHELFPESRLVYILRDPRDVVASHFKKGFNRTISEICKAWCNYIESFDRFRLDRPGRGLVVRYEDLVSESTTQVSAMLEFLGLEMEPEVLEFHRSKAGVHSYGHPNAENLRKGFFTTSVARWKQELERHQVEEIESLCVAGMETYGYEGVTS